MREQLLAGVVMLFNLCKLKASQRERFGEPLILTENNTCHKEGRSTKPTQQQTQTPFQQAHYYLRNVVSNRMWCVPSERGVSGRMEDLCMHRDSRERENLREREVERQRDIDENE